jgi:hypothetical protein
MMAKTVPVRFGKTGKPVRIMSTTVRRARSQDRRLYEDGTYGPPGSARAGQGGRADTPPRPKRTKFGRRPGNTVSQSGPRGIGQMGSMPTSKKLKRAVAQRHA